MEEERGILASGDKNIVVIFAPEQHQRSPRLFVRVERLDSQIISLNEFTTKLLDLGQLFGDGLRIIEQDRFILHL